jgi:hypothetical protein
VHRCFACDGGLGAEVAQGSRDSSVKAVPGKGRVDALIRAVCMDLCGRAKNPSPALAQLATCFHVGFLLGLCFDPEDGGNMMLRNADLFSTDCTTLYPNR